MKKILLGTAIVGVALASCVSEEANHLANQVKKNKITFDSPVMYGNENSRANVYGEIGSHTYGAEGAGQVTYSYPLEEQFQIYAVNHEGDFAGWAAEGNEAAGFNDTSISYDGDVDGWAPKKEDGNFYYWESGKKMTFAACSPADLAVDGCVRTYGADGLTIKDFAVNATPAKQYDLLFSTRSCNNTSANMQSGADKYSGVPVKFQHALSSIRFSLRNTSSEEVVLTGISISGVNYKGTFTENIAENNADYTQYERGGNVNPKWTVTSDVIAAPYVAFTGSVTFPSEAQYVSQLVAKANNNSEVHQLLLMPQNLSDNATVTVYYTVNGTPNTKEVILKGLNSVKNVDTVHEEYTAINAWEIGKRYTYRLYYSAETALKDKIYFAPETENWEDVDVIVVKL